MERIAVVTGAGSGIGREVSRALLGAGWKVALAGRREAPLRETLEGPRRRPRDPHRRHGRVRRALAVRAHAATSSGAWICCSTTPGHFGVPAAFEDVQLEDWRAVVDTNLTGAFLCAREAFRVMKEQDPQGGRIVNNGSISAHAPRPYATSYTATKHAITGLTKQLSLEGRRYDIACGQIDIGNATTEMTAAMSRGVPQADGSLQPEPVMDVRHVAEAVLYMAGLPLDGERPVHDRDGHEDAVCRTGLAAPPRPSRRGVSSYEWFLRGFYIRASRTSVSAVLAVVFLVRYNDA